jgi:lipopolysaccharide export system protein LptC
MTAPPLPQMGLRPPPSLVSREQRLLGRPSGRSAPTLARIARRGWTVAIAKRLLPLVALALLSSVALYPEFTKDADRARLSYSRASVTADGAQLVDARYHGVDERNRPYTMTAATAQQVGPERINLTDPKGDMNLESGNWLMVQSRTGVYMQHAGQLDLSDEVVLYRDDGTTLQTASASVDLHQGAAAGAEMVHAEGPFGTLDAQGFALTDRGDVIQFSGPGRMVLNGGHAK